MCVADEAVKIPVLICAVGIHTVVAGCQDVSILSGVLGDSQHGGTGLHLGTLPATLETWSGCVTAPRSSSHQGSAAPLSRETEKLLVLRGSQGPCQGTEESGSAGGMQDP